MSKGVTQRRSAKSNRFDRPWIKVTFMIGIFAIGATIVLLNRETIIEQVRIHIGASRAVFPPKQIFIAGSTVPSDTLGYTILPNSIARQYYEDNPRGYFQTGSSMDDAYYGWNVLGTKDVVLESSFASQKFSISINIKKIAPEAPPWAAGLKRAILRVPAGQKASFRFAISSDTKRAIQVFFWPPNDWSHPLQYADMEIDSNVKEHVIELAIAPVDRQVIVGINLGGETGQLQIHDLSLFGFEDDDPLSHAKKYFVEYQINKWGYRDKDWTIETPAGITRIACIGDSFAFGQGVKTDDVLSRVLESKLNADLAGGNKRFETLNFGLMGYSTEEELELFRTVAMKFSPKIIVVTMCSNDSISIRKDRELNKIHSRETEYEKYGDLLSKTVRETGFKGCVDLLLKMNSLCKENDMRLVVGVFNVTEGWESEHLASEVVPAMRNEGIPAFDITPDLQSAGYFGAKGLVHGRTDSHPNEHAHAIYAAKLASVIEKEVLPTMSK